MLLGQPYLRRQHFLRLELLGKQLRPGDLEYPWEATEHQQLFPLHITKLVVSTTHCTKHVLHRAIRKQVKNFANSWLRLRKRASQVLYSLWGAFTVTIHPRLLCSRASLEGSGLDICYQYTKYVFVT